MTPKYLKTWIIIRLQVETGRSVLVLWILLKELVFRLSDRV